MKLNTNLSGSLGVSSIKKTTTNKVIDASSSLLGYVRTLPEYSCKSTSSKLSADNSLTNKSFRRRRK